MNCAIYPSEPQRRGSRQRSGSTRGSSSP
ncbi:hypothetical protein F383_06853 [Gossypium arboreum]|uniref:Uncharacterized protein n=1 Tax=Gossypium arboreum TaxID=29729 RepID=A0A0B0PF51_GOSAR|nr:hypothetical protein F383_23682 [Gossypium arboreum]KHG25068.1 hypothetical protein F383_06853 [Gossypium arboreum]